MTGKELKSFAQRCENDATIEIKVQYSSDWRALQPTDLRAVIYPEKPATIDDLRTGVETFDHISAAGKLKEVKP
jgi:hypothetical protein